MRGVVLVAEAMLLLWDCWSLSKWTCVQRHISTCAFREIEVGLPPCWQAHLSVGLQVACPLSLLATVTRNQITQQLSWQMYIPFSDKNAGMAAVQHVAKCHLCTIAHNLLTYCVFPTTLNEEVVFSAADTAASP